MSRWPPYLQSAVGISVHVLVPGRKRDNYVRRCVTGMDNLTLQELQTSIANVFQASVFNLFSSTLKLAREVNW